MGIQSWEQELAVGAGSGSLESRVETSLLTLVCCACFRNYEQIVKAHQDNPNEGKNQISDELKFSVFQGIMDSLFQSFNASVSVTSFQELSACVFSWIEEHCKPQVNAEGAGGMAEGAETVAQGWLSLHRPTDHVLSATDAAGRCHRGPAQGEEPALLSLPCHCCACGDGALLPEARVPGTTLGPLPCGCY